MYSICIFDLDGTLINSLEDLADSANFILEQNKLPTHTTNLYRQFVGNGIYKLVERILPAALRDPAHVTAVKEQFDAYYHLHCMDKTKPYLGIESLLKTLKTRGIKLAVLSNKSDAFAQEICAHIFGQHLFDAVCGQRDDVRKKPAPDGVFSLLNDFGCTAHDAVLIGDSNVDILTAQNAGIDSIGVLWGFRGEEELTAAGATYLAFDAKNLENVLIN